MKSHLILAGVAAAVLVSCDARVETTSPPAVEKDTTIVTPAPSESKTTVVNPPAKTESSTTVVNPPASSSSTTTTTTKQQ